jgi:hypothetical protein
VPAVLYRPRRGVAVAGLEELRDRSVRRRVCLVWGLLLLNAVGYTGLVVPVPGAFGKLITQGALPVALIVLLTVNRRLVVRPNVFLCLARRMQSQPFVGVDQPDHLRRQSNRFPAARLVGRLPLEDRKREHHPQRDRLQPGEDHGLQQN